MDKKGARERGEGGKDREREREKEREVILNFMIVYMYNNIAIQYYE